jgi:hypothetical protein
MGIKRIAAAGAVSLFTAFAALAQTPNFDWFTADPGAAAFTVSTADELAGLAALVNNTAGAGQPFDFKGRTVTLAASVNLANYGKNHSYTVKNVDGAQKVSGWRPIGASKERAFCGTFDGNGKTVAGLYIEGPLSNAGLFGAVGGVVKNLAVDDVKISAGNYAGAVAGFVYGKDSKAASCYSSGTVHSGDGVGGVVGSVEGGSVANCYTVAAVSGARWVGGVVGSVEPNSGVTHCYSAGNVSAAGDYAGGVAGRVRDNSNVANCYSTGAVSGVRWAGGVAGSVGGTASKRGSITNCYSTAAVSGDNRVGGIVGGAEPNSRVANCAALNQSVKSTGTASGRVAGEVSAPVELANNAAFKNMSVAPPMPSSRVKAADNRDGADISAAAVNIDGAIGGRFTGENGWAVQKGSLPGFGKPIAMPKHLQADAAAIAAEEQQIKLREAVGKAISTSEQKK